jgi:hypothetical protein
VLNLFFHLLFVYAFQSFSDLNFMQNWMIRLDFHELKIQNKLKKLLEMSNIELRVSLIGIEQFFWIVCCSTTIWVLFSLIGFFYHGIIRFCFRLKSILPRLWGTWYRYLDLVFAFLILVFVETFWSLNYFLATLLLITLTFLDLHIINTKIYIWLFKRTIFFNRLFSIGFFLVFIRYLIRYRIIFMFWFG